MEMERLEEITRMVQHNCNISDAQHAQTYTMCTYLMKMREYFRWEQGHLFTDDIPKAALGDWIKDREDIWTELAEASYRPIQIEGRSIDPFDAEQLNAYLSPQGYLYSAGYGRHGRAHFFIGEITAVKEQPEFVLYYTGRELARDLTSPPAMLQANKLYIRKESYKRMIWEKIEEWRWFKNKQHTPMGQALDAYGFNADPAQALEDIAEGELNTVVWHEMGEWRALCQLGDAWLDMVQQLLAKHENIARAVKDLLADCEMTLPNILKQDRPAAVHFYFSHLQSTQKSLFPSLFHAYHQWCADGDMQPLQACIRQGAVHWLAVARGMLARSQAGQAFADPESIIQDIRL